MENRKYSWQNCQDNETDRRFKELHHHIVNEIIIFCKENNIEIDEFNLSANGVRESIRQGKWCPMTDSCFSLEESIYAELGGRSPLEISNEEYKVAKINHLPYLISL